MNEYTISGKKNKIAKRYNYGTYETSKKNNLISEGKETLSKATQGAIREIEDP